MGTALFSICLAQAEGTGVFTYFSQSNTAGKVIVILLALFSMVAWTVMVGKWLELRRLRALNRRFERKLKRSHRVMEMEEPLGAGAYAKLAQEALTAYYRYDTEQAKARMGHVENALQRGVSAESHRYESRMVLLGSIVTGAPFLGLLGTVWGVMDAFGGMALKSSATLQNLAPGVSGALLTTVAGLVVAIPSVFGYNFLLTQTKLMITELENFASSLADRIELEVAYTTDPDEAPEPEEEEEDFRLEQDDGDDWQEEERRPF